MNASTGWTARILLVAFGFALFGVLELAIRLFLPAPASPASGFGETPVFQRDVGPDGKALWVTHAARRHSFPLQSFSAERPEGEVLVFCLGGSSVYGYPHGADFAFPRRLEDRLRSQYGDKDFEIVNVGGMSYGSERLWRLARDLVRYEPDALVVYTGHNEFIESEFFAADLEASSWLSWLRHQASRLHLFRHVSSLIESETPSSSSDPFGLDVQRREGRILSDEERRLARDRYRTNLQRIAAITRAEHIPLLLATVPANLSGWAPESSLFSPSLGTAQLLTAARWAARADEMSAQGLVEEEVSSLEKALDLDPTQAALNFRAGRRLLSLGRFHSARERFVAALVTDATPIRILPEFVEVIRETAALPDVHLVDVERAFDREAEPGIPGDDLFLDYCHPNARGHELIAAEISPILEEALQISESPLEQIDLGRSEPEPEPEEGGKSDDAPSDARPRKTEASGAFGAWWRGNVEMRQGRPAAALEAFQHALEQSPDAWRPAVGLGQALVALGRADEALAAFQRATDLAPEESQAWNSLGIHLGRLGRFAEARIALERSLRLDEKASGVRNNLAGLLLLEKKPTEALPLLLAERTRSPHLLGVHRNLGLALLQTGDSAGACRAFADEIRRNPRDRRSAELLGSCSEELGRREDAELARALVDQIDRASRSASAARATVPE